MAAKKLASYHAKRNFTKTPEPQGKASVAPAKYPRFVVQKHAASQLHYDFRLEHEGVFKSWAVTKGPSCNPRDKRLAVEVEDHPLDYGDFEGTIPKGEYGGGTVMLWDRGFWVPEDETANVDAALHRGELKFTVAGEKLRGSWVLVRMRGREGDHGRRNWLLIKHRDAFACESADALLAGDRSVASGRDMDQITAGKGRGPKPFMTVRSTPPDLGASKSRHRTTAEPKTATPGRKRAEAQSKSKSGTVTIKGVAISKPEKELWPATDGSHAVTKLDLGRYLETIGPSMIPHLKGRPCAILRAPDGIDQETWLQRHAGRGLSSQVSETIVDGEHKPYLQIDDVEGLIAMAQSAAVEFHPWNCAPGEPDLPGRLVFDLDPGPGVEFSAVTEAAKELRDRLEPLGLVAFCKTTGGKGLHVVTPLKVTKAANVGWDEAKTFAQTLSAAMADDNPERYVVNMAKKHREGRIFLDYLRNDRTASAVAPLSPRAHPGAPVAMPLSWSQVRNGLDPSRFTIETAPALLARSKPWQDYRDAARPLEPAIRKLDRARS
jgi:bifunctional non-homologous end joining protein LigD